MRYKLSKVGDTRIKKRFLLFPKKINSEISFTSKKVRDNFSCKEGFIKYFKTEETNKTTISFGLLEVASSKKE